jgi:predicted AlkP superfamily pyrophosphatase or phosphodiesterase
MRLKIKFLFALGVTTIWNGLYGQSNAASADPVFGNPPRLVVGIVVDQMRFDYLTRFWDKFEDDGFKRLVNEGFVARNHHFNYAPTSTGPGHASVYTGTTPAVHGIIGNDWFDKESGKSVYCAGDESVSSVGTDSKAGKNSPQRLLVTTVTDELRLHYQMRSKVIAVALKDRGAVLPGGHTANAAYWWEGGSTGNWISSTYYMDKLPRWVDKFNASGNALSYRKPWNTLSKIDKYVESVPDNVKYESTFRGEAAPVFPHNLPKLWDENGKFELLRITPYGNSITLDFALEALDNEALGADEIPDFLAISFSSTDYVGHKFGVDSKEVEDTYLRLDQDLARMLKHLDRKVGANNYTVFLTADHGALPVQNYLKDQKIPAGYLDLKTFREKLDEYAKITYGAENLIRDVSNAQIFLDYEVLQDLKLNAVEVRQCIADELINYPEIQQVFTSDQMLLADFTSGLPSIFQKGFNPKRSGDLILVHPPGYASYTQTGSTHGSPYPYDTHTPLLIYGKGIRPGSTVRRTTIPDIAPTVATLLGIAFPNGTTGEPIPEALK